MSATVLRLVSLHDRGDELEARFAQPGFSSDVTLRIPRGLYLEPGNCYRVSFEITNDPQEAK